MAPRKIPTPPLPSSVSQKGSPPALSTTTCTTSALITTTKLPISDLDDLEVELVVVVRLWVVTWVVQVQDFRPRAVGVAQLLSVLLCLGFRLEDLVVLVSRAARTDRHNLEHSVPPVLKPCRTVLACSTPVTLPRRCAVSLLPLGVSPGTCRITFTTTTGLPGHKGTPSTEVLADGAWIWIRPLSSASQDARFARLRTVVTHQANVDESINPRLGAVLEHVVGDVTKAYTVKGLTPPGPSILMPNQGWILDLEEVL